ncbi:hypothetical protein T265_07437 [Opisthorchis viverrini]|uniref:Protein kinase domain-containing protein n=1 Tax=Opisthorchis viverrini TaxID=6198 RepID=A0A074ZCN2_OPIVI|nr:hypothetical protein T265_07437 [Opisthorchis viverrini]KER25046.1 hypothetical protein T265_07437 [Opisthorchis viverrini]
MDSVIHKIKTKVSNVLPGNPLTREYDLGKQIGSAGPGMLWKLFAAKKRSTQQEATVWAFDKKSIDNYPKSQKESMIEILKYGVATLTRIKHPKVLSVLQPLEESRESLAFASEPLFSSLKSVISESTSNPKKSDTRDGFSLTDVEIKYGLLQLTEALTFLHSDCRRVHLNLVSEAVVINKYGLWKLAGFEFSKVVDHRSSDGQTEPSASVPMWQSSIMPACQPTLVASSPEAVLQGHVTPASDMFSLGMLIYSLCNRGQSLIPSENDYSAYRRDVKNLVSVYSGKIATLPENLREYVRMALSKDPDIRPTALQFSRTPYFEDAAMSVLRSVDNMYQLDNLARSQFYKSLPSTIHTLPKRLCLFRVFPQISEDFSNQHMVPFILPAVLQIMDLVTQQEFVQYMLPRLIPVMAMKEPIQILLVLLQNLRVLSEKFPAAEFRIHVLPMLHSSLDTDNKTVQELCLRSIPSIASLTELTTLKNAVLPRIQKLFFRTELLSTRLSCLMCIGKLLDHLDKWIVMDDVLTFLQQIRSREPSLLIAMLGIYRLAFSHEKLGISREKLATRVLPHLIPLSIEGSLNLKQYLAFAELIRDMCSQLEREQKAKLEQLHGIAEEPNILGVGTSMSNGWTSANSCATLMDQIMRTFVDSTSGLIDQTSEDKKPSAPPNSVSEHMSDLEIKPTVTLSLEQKRQLAAERSQQQRLQGQGLDAIQPTKKDPTSTKPTPRDLTSTLIESNLFEMANRANSIPSSRTFQPGLPLALVRPPATPYNDYISMPHYSVGAGLNLSATINPPTTRFPCTQARWDPPRNTTAGSYASFQQPTNHSLTEAAPFTPNLASAPSLTEQYKPLSKVDIDDLLS